MKPEKMRREYAPPTSKLMCITFEAAFAVSTNANIEDYTEENY